MSERERAESTSYYELPRGLRVTRPALGDPHLGPLELHGEFDVDGVRATGDEMRDARASGTLAQSRVCGADLAGSRLGPLELADVLLEQSDLSGAIWHGVRARRVEVRSCRGLGWVLDVERAQEVYLADCRLDYATIRVERASGVLALRDCSLREATISGNLANAVFAGCDLDGAEFAATAADGCDLRGSRIETARGLLTLRGALIEAEQAMLAAPMLAASTGLVVTE